MFKVLFQKSNTKSIFYKRDELSNKGVIKQELLKKLSVTLPPLVEQKKIGDYLDKKEHTFNKLILKSNNKIDLLKERRTALISAAVTGKIDVRNWVAPTTSSDTNEVAQEVTA
ncbi:restriction endonuclease subunit S [Photobacterium kishitanii]|uniref:restriction endonuclease subunit S n=1 Tax=Photobacterium kishitanii TaxID=318456 RepID=UPI00191C4658|nr:restriction endonuclease subunit S [Photobacterium kishitanii]